MVCTFCKKNKEELKQENLHELENISKAISSIQSKLQNINSPSVNNNNQKINNEILILQHKKHELENVHEYMKVIELKKENDNKYRKIMKQYLPDFKKEEHTNNVYICNDCSIVLNTLIENVLYEKMGEIIETIQENMEE
jgi:hypothetical protein